MHPDTAAAFGKIKKLIKKIKNVEMALYNQQVNGYKEPLSKADIVLTINAML